MGMEIGPVRLDSPVLLAPMSGVSDLPFRRLVKTHGAGLVMSEMIASREMVRATRQSVRRAATVTEERPMAVQLAGTDPEIMAEAARLAADLGAAIVDINYGCPAKKVVNRQAGSALMRDEGLAARIMEAVVRAVALPVTVKMRTGWDETSRNAPRLARIAETCGIRMVTVHGRTRCQLFRGEADWAFIRAVKDAVSIPVVANGDIRSVADAGRCLAASGADGLMIGRACQGRPWFLRQVAHFLGTGARLAEPSLAVRRATLEGHLEAMLHHYGRERGMRVARKHLAWYAHGLPGAAEFRNAVNATLDPARVQALIGRFFGPLIEREAA